MPMIILKCPFSHRELCVNVVMHNAQMVVMLTFSKWILIAILEEITVTNFPENSTLRTMRSYSPKTNLKMKVGDSMTMAAATDTDVIVEISISHVRSKTNKADHMVTENVIIKNQPRADAEAFTTRTTAIVTKTQLVVIEYKAEEKEADVEDGTGTGKHFMFTTVTTIERVIIHQTPIYNTT